MPSIITHRGIKGASAMWRSEDNRVMAECSPVNTDEYIKYVRRRRNRGKRVFSTVPSKSGQGAVFLSVCGQKDWIHTKQLLVQPQT